MNTQRTVLLVLLATVPVSACEREATEGAAPSQQPSGEPVVLDTALIERFTGARGKLEEGGVFKVSVPREGLDLTIQGTRMTPPLGLTSWAAFQATGDGAIVAGDLVLLESEVNPVMSAALETGLEVTALHNHFFWDDPKVMFMHVGGRGPQDTLAAAVGEVFARMRAAWRGEVPVPARADIAPSTTTLDPAVIEAALGQRGEFKDGVYKVTVGRTTEMGGVQLGGPMGVNTWAAFAGSEERAVVDGDFAVEENELQSVLEALRRADIQIVAIHNHMAGESPRILFLHFWGVGPAAQLARGIRAGLEVMGGMGAAR